MAPFAILLLFVLTCSFPCSSYGTSNQPSYSALYAFGDSILDTGNNNFIPTVLQSNHAPYGVSFPGSTGRFSNGKLISDFLVSSLGIKHYLPPFLDPNLSNDELITGVCFASAGSGYDEITSAALHIIPVVKQLGLFQSYINRLTAIVGQQESKRIIESSLILVSAGSNDHLISYYDSGARKIQFPNIEDYHDFLHSRMAYFVEGLHEFGARRMVVMGIPPIGCLPLQKALSLLPGSCVDYQNKDSVSFNEKLKKNLALLEGSLHGTKIAYAEVYQPFMDIIASPHSFGMDDVSGGCCGTGYLELAYLCSKGSPTCSYPNCHLFFDSVHPSEAAYWYIFQYFKKKLFDGSHF